MELATPIINSPIPLALVNRLVVAPTNSFIPFPLSAIAQSIPERFEQQVRQYPNRLAVQSRQHTLTYNDLNKTANQVARTILAQRPSGAEPIALLLEKEAPTIATILGVLKAGKFYVPLDPSLPQPRLSSMLEDAQIGLIITNNQHLSLAKELASPGLLLLNLDELDPESSTENLGLAIAPDTLTWILYTSGSTGQPKGVVQTHCNVLHFVMNYTNYFHLCPDDRLTLLLSCSVNGGAHDIFATLLNGASLHLLDIKKEGIANLAHWLIQEEITIYCSVPTLFRHFMDTLIGTEEFPGLRLIRLIGEPVYKRDVEKYKRHFSPDCLLVNRLGSTETGSLLFYFMNKETQIIGHHVPVGYAVEGNEILLLDEAGKAVGDNEIGEIAVKSRYLSPGYWRRPDLTQAKFLPDPAGGDERIYLTGDLGGRLPDGGIVCLGRKDFQVKIRGYRIELAEIETALLALDSIKEAVVMAQEDHTGDQRLVAYLIPKSHPAPTVATLRHHLAETLPTYMIPAAFVFLEAFPLAPNGKINRKALPAPDSVRPVLAMPFVPPRTPVEEKLVAIWEEVLGLEQVGIHDNFFAVGGHSLLAAQVLTRVREQFQVDLPLRDFFADPTVAGLIIAIVRQKAEQIAPEAFARLIAEVEELSSHEVQQLLAGQNPGGGT